MCGKYRQTCAAASSLVCEPQSMAGAKTGRGKGDGVRSRGKREDSGLVSISTRNLLKVCKENRNSNYVRFHPMVEEENLLYAGFVGIL